MNNECSRKVYIVDGSRTPQLKSRGKVGPFSAGDLAVAAAKPLLLRNNFPLDALDEVILGCMMPGVSHWMLPTSVACRCVCATRCVSVQGVLHTRQVGATRARKSGALCRCALLMRGVPAQCVAVMQGALQKGRQQAIIYGAGDFRRRWLTHFRNSHGKFKSGFTF